MSEQSWQTPPAPIHQILTAPPAPTVFFSPTQQWFLELEQPSLCSIVELAAPEVAVAGFRLNPQTNSPARSNPYRQLWITELATGIKRGVSLPDPVQISFLHWSPDGQKIAFTLTQSNGLELWAMELAVGKPWRVTEPILNGTYGSPYCWQSNEAFLCKVLVPDRGGPPIAPQVPTPRIQENLGRKTPSRTYTNLLSSPYDEALFEYYVTSTLEQISLAGQRTSIVASALISSVVPSPDGQYILLETLHRPFSYQVPASRFPKCIQILDQQGSLIHQLADLPLDDQRSTKFDAVRPGARAIRWRSDRPASLFWVEALDGGDPTQAVPQRDRGLELNAPFTEPPQELWRSQYRFRRIRWGRDNVALLWERDYDTRQLRLWRIHPDQPQTPPTLLIDRSFEDRYRDPGMALMTPGAYGRHVLRFSSDGQSIYFSGRGASPEGVYPFLDRMELVTRQTERIWQCQAPYFEGVVVLLKDMTLITRRQSKTEPPNYFKRSLGQDQLLPLTHYTDPAPQFAGVQKEVVRYQRADGVALSAKLYLPAGYDPQKDGALPMLFWIYPEEFKNRDLAGQVTIAENAFSRPRYASVLFLLTQGYAILDNPTLPIIGEETIEPNDTYVEQLIAGAEAAVSYVVERGVADRDRLGIGGHSYGAFTAANLLAHTSLFRLGIARSGAYNRTLTPFGFQGEQRHFWEASTTYMQMSPFTHAATITAPLLLIHGASDSNVGTYPLQTERFYEALKGLGATVRWVELPLEDHSYRSQESVGHVLWEMVRWCDRYLKGLPER